MRAVFWIRKEANERALVCRIHAQFPLAGIVLEHRPPKKSTWQQFFSRATTRMLAPAISSSWHGMLKEYAKEFPHYPNVPILEVSDINDPMVEQFTRDLQPDVIAVSGTALVRKPLITAFANIGILNLHTGLSPYVKGGPNCTNWCLATGQFHLIGNTVMWLDEGIDSGRIVISEVSPLEGTYDLYTLHRVVMDHAHDVYARCLKTLREGRLESVEQDSLAKGTTYLNRQWTAWQAIKAQWNIRLLTAESAQQEERRQREGVRCVQLQVSKQVRQP